MKREVDQKIIRNNFRGRPFLRRYYRRESIRPRSFFKRYEVSVKAER